MEVSSGVRAQLDRLTSALQATLGDALVGLYLHGSLAFGCFNAAQSDIDVLAVTARGLTRNEKLALVDCFLRVSLDPHAIEADILEVEDLRNWRHPSPFELHYSEWRRERWAEDPEGTLASFPAENTDLAAHVSVVRARGVALVGPPPQEIFPRVLDADLRDSLLRDLDWARETQAGPLYGILSPCRIWSTLETGEVQSKASGAQWALARLPENLRPMVERALATYTGVRETIDVDADEQRQLHDFVKERLRR